MTDDEFREWSFANPDDDPPDCGRNSGPTVTAHFVRMNLRRWMRELSSGESVRDPIERISCLVFIRDGLLDEDGTMSTAGYDIRLLEPEMLSQVEARLEDARRRLDGWDAYVTHQVMTS